MSLNDEIFSIDSSGMYSINGTSYLIEPMVTGRWKARSYMYEISPINIDDKYRFLQVILICLQSIPDDHIVNIIKYELMMKTIGQECIMQIGTKDHYIEMSLNKIDNIFIHRNDDNQVDMLGILHHRSCNVPTRFHIIKGYEVCIFMG